MRDEARRCSWAAALRRARLAAIVCGAGVLSACATNPVVSLDPGWVRTATDGPAALRTARDDVEVLARRTDDASRRAPLGLGGTILHRGPATLDAEFLPPADGVGAATVTVTTAAAADGTGAERAAPETSIATPGARYRIGPGTAHAPASLSFVLHAPDAGGGEVPGDRCTLACTIVLRSDQTSVSIPFRFTVERDDPTRDALRIAAVVVILAGLVHVLGAWEVLFRPVFL